MQTMLRQIGHSSISSLDDPFWIVWRKVKPLVQKALEHSDEYSLGDVLHFAHSGMWQLWHGHQSVAFTRLVVYPQHKVCVFILAAGELSEITALEPQICQWAKEQGCKYVEIYGRRGWKRSLPAYDEQSVILRKALT